MKFPSDKSFFEFLTTKQGSPVWLILIVALAILLLGAGGQGKSRESTPSEETAEICSMISGVGECRVMITYREENEVFAVAILCDGAENPTVRRDITELVCSLYGIGSHRVSILPLK